jgi:hypothetical protein
MVGQIGHSVSSRSSVMARMREISRADAVTAASRRHGPRSSGAREYRSTQALVVRVTSRPLDARQGVPRRAASQFATWLPSALPTHRIRAWPWRCWRCGHSLDGTDQHHPPGADADPDRGQR